jgi:hypothetical protein
VELRPVLRVPVVNLVELGDELDREVATQLAAGAGTEETDHRHSRLLHARREWPTQPRRRAALFPRRRLS